MVGEATASEANRVVDAVRCLWVATRGFGDLTAVGAEHVVTGGCGVHQVGRASAIPTSDCSVGTSATGCGSTIADEGTEFSGVVAKCRGSAEPLLIGAISQLAPLSRLSPPESEAHEPLAARR